MSKAGVEEKKILLAPTLNVFPTKLIRVYRSPVGYIYKNGACYW